MTDIFAELAGNSDQQIFNTDTGNARRLVKYFGNIVRYAIDSETWYVWGGKRWIQDRAGVRILGLTEGVIDRIRTLEIDSVPADDLERWTRWVTSQEAEAPRRKMIKLATANPEIGIEEKDLDANPWLLVVENGTLDLRTGQVRASNPADLCTRQAAVTYDKNATCPNWIKHVEKVMHGDPLMMAYLQRCLGYCLTGAINEQKFWFLWGSGQNGKNVFAETIVNMLGDYADVAPPGLLTGGTKQHSSILAGLRGARMILADETGHEKINDVRIKQLTGSAQIRAQAGMARDYFTYDSTMKLWILGNEKPGVTDQSDGIWRRMQLTPFTVKIPDGDVIQQYDQVLSAERSGILNWCLEGLASYLALGSLGTPEVVKVAVQEYRAEEDLLGHWVADHVELCSADEWTANSTIYNSYSMWCMGQGIKERDILTAAALGKQLTTRKIGESKLISVDGTKMRVRLGVKVKGLTAFKAL